MTMTDSTMTDSARVDAERLVAQGKDLREVANERGLASQAQIAAIKADTRLSPEGKAADIAAIKQRSDVERKVMGEVFEAQLRGEAETLRRKLLSPPETYVAAERIAQEMSYRDAFQRARSTSTDNRRELMDMFRSASMMSDGLQQRAAVAVAMERDDVDVLNAWIEANPNDGERLNRLYDLERELNSTAARVHRSMHFQRL
jgi:hypothetical protein